MIPLNLTPNIRLKSENACKSNDDSAKSFRKSLSESGVKKFGARKKSDDDSLSKSLLSVPSIYVDNVDAESTMSCFFDSASMSEEDQSLTDLNPVDPETISMIVRNVEAFEQMDTRRDSDEIDGMVDVELPKEEPPADPSEQKVGSPKKHDFIHDLKGSIQEKFHHLSDNIKKHDVMHKTESPPREHGKFHGLKENMSGKFHQIAEKMHHFHLPHLPHHHHEVPQEGLVGQAMQTILMDKFNIVEASTAVNNSADPSQKRKSSASSLQSIKQKFNLFQRPRRSIEMQSETCSLKSISEVNAMENTERRFDEAMDIEDQELPYLHDDNSSILELKIHEETHSATSDESLITVLSFDRKSVSKESLQLSVENFDSILSTHKTYPKTTATFADTNKAPLHESLLSLSSRNEVLSTSPGVKMHARTESIGCKFSASPSKNVTGSLGRDQITGIHRRSSDSDLSITPKGE